MPLTSTLTPYDPHWPQAFADEAAALRPIFGAALVDLHHIGSTSVPGLSAKPEIDLLAVVGDAGEIDGWTLALAGRGYRRGGDLSAGHHFFKRDVGGVRTHKLHVCRERHPMARAMLRFRDYLRASPEDRAAYAALKLRLEAANTGGIAEYLAAKAPFIRAVLERFADEERLPNCIESDTHLG